MHEYASDSSHRKYVFLVLAALSVAAAWLLHLALKAAGVDHWWWVKLPSVLGFYGFFFWIYDTIAWKKFSKLPDLNGTWVGEIETSFGELIRKPCVLYIDQTWSRLLVNLQTDHSRSTSTMAALHLGGSRESGLRYEFINEPTALSPETMHAHRGVCHLELSPDLHGLAGSYYTGRDRENNGRLRFSFVSRKRLDFAKTVSEVKR